jgi:REP element-mobilizing transposase RayT
MSDHIHKRHNKNVLLYHIVCPIKYRKAVLTQEREETLKQTCAAIAKRFEIHFVEIGTDEDHVHFLAQSVPNLLLARMVQIIKSLTAREMFQKHPELKKELWGGNFWTSGYYVNTVGQYGNEDVIRNYVKSQGRQYQQIKRDQLNLFAEL